MDADFDMNESFQTHLQTTLDEIRDAGLYKSERVITTPQSPHVGVQNGGEVLNLCANNYLGLSDHPEVKEAARDAIERWGFGLSSVRFICGTQTLHKDLESRLSGFLGTEDTILYSSCFDANGCCCIDATFIATVERGDILLAPGLGNNNFLKVKISTPLNS